MKKKANIQKLKEYGFKKNGNKFSYNTEILNGDFILNIDITEGKEIQTELIEKEFNEPYTLHLVEGANGTFVGKIREEYQKIIDNIKEKCFEIKNFEWKYSYRVLDYAKEKYNSPAEYLWPKFPRNAICRRQDNNKWYFAILSVQGNKLGLETDEIIEVIDLRVPEDDLPRLIKQKKFYPAYHMNKKHWITIILDGSVPIDEIFKFIDKSYELAKKSS